MTNRRKKSIARFALISSALVMSASRASACYTVHFENNSQRDVHAIWVAWGCAGVAHWITTACETKTIKAGESQSYDYNWGTTRPTLVTFQDLSKDDKPVSEVVYALHKGKFVLTEDVDRVYLESAPKCGVSYTIAFSENDRLEWLN